MDDFSKCYRSVNFSLHVYTCMYTVVGTIGHDYCVKVHCSTGPSSAGSNLAIYIAVPIACFLLVAVLTTLIGVSIIVLRLHTHSRKGTCVVVNGY